jgi:hypothetical protein
VAVQLGDPDSVAARLSDAAERLKATREPAAPAAVEDESPALARLDAATAALEPIRAELADLRTRLDALAGRGRR